MLLQWNDRFATGMVEADYEHRKLIDLINGVHARWLKDGRSDSPLFFERLFNILLSHFAIEDGLMNEMGHYALRESHEDDHNKVLGELRTIVARADSDGYDFAPALSQCLDHWLSSHIQTHDVSMHKALRLSRSAGTEEWMRGE